MKKVIFIAADHTYWLIDDEKKGFKTKEHAMLIPSVGHYYGQFFPPYESDYWLTHGSLKYLLGETKFKEIKDNMFGSRCSKPPAEEFFPVVLALVDPTEFFKTRKALKEEWQFKKELKAWKGSRFHKEQEDLAESTGKVTSPFSGKEFKLMNPKKEYDNESICMNLYDLKPGVYTELLVSHFELDEEGNLIWCVAGQIDECYIEKVGKKKCISINDWKTNDELPAKSAMEYGLGPFEDIMASKHNKYCVQLSFYAYILQKAGFEVKDVAYTFCKNYDLAQQSLQFVDYKGQFVEKVEKCFQKA